FEVNQAAAIIKETAHPDVNLIFGAVIDPTIGDELRVTVIATGFEQAGPARRTARRAPTTRRDGKGEVAAEAAAVEAFQPSAFDLNDLDIPAFLRRR
ncbi:MAG: ftsZ, partial [Anaerolineales bacterium]|nr:ftsZ [Anaerolineales bacterium]